MDKLLIYLDGQIVSESEAKVSVFDHGLLYGDGIFEGIRFYNGGGQLPTGYDYGIFLAIHGSLLHDPAYGYEVRFVSLRPGKMAQGDQVAITGWLVDGKYWGRPVDVVFGKDGAMYISDDAGGAVYRVSFR